MRIDQELVRRVLLKWEAEEPVDLAAYTAEQVTYHEAQLIKAGLLEGEVKQVALAGSPLVLVTDLSWEGHQFLANIRNDKVWKRVVAEIAKLGGSFSIDVLTALAKQKALEIIK